MPQKYLALTSSISVLINVFVVFAVALNFVLYYRKQPTALAANEWTAKGDICLVGVSSGSIAMVSGTLMAAAIQSCIPPMYEEMAQRSPEKFNSALKVSMVLQWFLFAAFCSLGYFTYGDNVEGNLLKNLAATGQWYVWVVQIGMVFVLITVYPLMLNPMVAGFKNPFWRMCIVLSIIVVSTISALFLEDLDMVNNLSGATSAFFFVALFPAVVAIRLLYKPQNAATQDDATLEAAEAANQRNQGQKKQKTFGIPDTWWNISLIIFGFAMMVAGYLDAFGGLGPSNIPQFRIVDPAVATQTGRAEGVVSDNKYILTFTAYKNQVIDRIRNVKVPKTQQHMETLRSTYNANRDAILRGQTQGSREVPDGVRELYLDPKHRDRVHSWQEDNSSSRSRRCPRVLA